MCPLSDGFSHCMLGPKDIVWEHGEPINWAVVLIIPRDFDPMGIVMVVI